MTDSVEAPERPGRRQDKRERLIAAACQVMYAQGVEKTTLADIAAAAGIPLGNVYYYFKTKDDLLQAVIETHLHEIGAMIAAIEAAHAAPRPDRAAGLPARFAVPGVGQARRRPRPGRRADPDPR
jgi:AcrR family transcriptional regulator